MFVLRAAFAALTVSSLCLMGGAGANVHGERASDGAFSPRDAHHGHGEDHDSKFDHEAILGSAKEAEEFEHLSPAESKRRLGILLEKMDLNSDRKIGRKEMKQWILRSFRALSQEESTERFLDYDADKNGAVDWLEYLREEFGVDEASAATAAEVEQALRGDPNRADEYQLLEEDHVLFNAADRNGDGRLDTSEFLAFSHPEEVEEMHEVVLAQILTDKDKNGDGAIDFMEYMGDRGKDQTKDWIQQEKDRYDQELDKDKDGKMNTSEILAWMIPSNDELADAEVDHLFSGADEDVDGEVSFEEALARRDLFVGSEVTDYGEHLVNINKFQDEL